MDVKELEEKVKTLENEIRRLADIEEIKKLQRIYGYYLDHHMGDAIVDLFSNDTESVETNGVYLGKEGAKRLFKNRYDVACPPGWLGRHMIQQGVIDVDPDGKTAKGRWGVFYCLASPVDGELKALWGHGLYENEYVKEDGKWKFRKFQLFRNFVTPYEDGWVKTGDYARMDPSGFLYLEGRISDTINVGGFLVNPLEVEEVLLKHPWVDEAVVYRDRDAILGEVVAARVVLKKDANGNEQDLREFGVGNLSHYKVSGNLIN